VTGNQPNGCLQFVIDVPEPPADPQDPDNPVEPQGDTGGTGGTGGGTTPGVVPGTTPGTTPPVVKDTTGPGVSLKGLGTRVRRTTLAGRKGVAAKVACTEACAFTARVEVTKRGRKKASTIMTLKRTARTTSTRTLRLKVKRASLRGLARQRATLVIRATDAAGNATIVRRTITLR
jgi:hypothetical protein